MVVGCFFLFQPDVILQNRKCPFLAKITPSDALSSTKSKNIWLLSTFLNRSDTKPEVPLSIKTWSLDDNVFSK